MYEDNYGDSRDAIAARPWSKKGRRQIPSHNYFL